MCSFVTPISVSRLTSRDNTPSLDRIGKRTDNSTSQLIEKNMQYMELISYLLVEATDSQFNIQQNLSFRLIDIGLFSKERNRDTRVRVNSLSLLGHNRKRT